MRVQLPCKLARVTLDTARGFSANLSPGELVFWQPSAWIEHGDSVRWIRTPRPENEVMVVVGRTGSEARHKGSGMPLGDEPLRDEPRRRLVSSFSISEPGA